jgi:hypothetical protein
VVEKQKDLQDSNDSLTDERFGSLDSIRTALGTLYSFAETQRKWKCRDPAKLRSSDQQEKCDQIGRLIGEKWGELETEVDEYVNRHLRQTFGDQMPLVRCRFKD